MQNKSSGQMWFYHAPSKRNETQEKQLVPAASQIPGLAHLDEMDQEAWEREVGLNKKSVRDTDSNYIRLAKQGGRKNLLSFNYKTSQASEDSAKPYPRVDWFDHQECDEEKDQEILKKSSWYPPEYMVHDEYTGNNNTHSNEPQMEQKRKRAPFYTDNKSMWTRNDEEVKVPKRHRRRNKDLPKLPDRPTKKDQVSFSKLIGGEYGNDWFKSHLDAKRVSPVKTKTYEKPKEKGYLNMTEYQQVISKKTIPGRKLKPIVLPPIRKQTEHEKPQFKLSKFNNVQSKLTTNGAA